MLKTTPHHCRNCGLTILEALAVLFTSTLLLIVVVPVAMVHLGYLKPPAIVGKDGPPEEVKPQTFAPAPIPTPSLPEPPKIPSIENLRVPESNPAVPPGMSTTPAKPTLDAPKSSTP
jgi:hypothetical protein